MLAVYARTVRNVRLLLTRPVVLNRSICHSEGFDIAIPFQNGSVAITDERVGLQPWVISVLDGVEGHVGAEVVRRGSRVDSRVVR